MVLVVGSEALYCNFRVGFPTRAECRTDWILVIVLEVCGIKTHTTVLIEVIISLCSDPECSAYLSGIYREYFECILKPEVAQCNNHYVFY